MSWPDEGLAQDPVFQEANQAMSEFAVVRGIGHPLAYVVDRTRTVLKRLPRLSQISFRLRRRS